MEEFEELPPEEDFCPTAPAAPRIPPRLLPFTDGFGEEDDLEEDEEDLLDDDFPPLEEREVGFLGFVFLFKVLSLSSLNERFKYSP